MTSGFKVMTTVDCFKKQCRLKSKKLKQCISMGMTVLTLVILRRTSMVLWSEISFYGDASCNIQKCKYIHKALNMNGNYIKYI